MQTKTHLNLRESDLPKLAAEYAPLWLRPGTVVALHGDLGMGKSAFVRTFIRHVLGADTAVPSPTFTLVQPYETSALTIYHYDLYRLSDASELTELNWDTATREGLVFVEWPERAGKNLPPHWKIEITDGDTPDARNVVITPPVIIDTAMVLAAGFGTRLRPLTDHTPKPLLKLGNQTMLDQVLDHLADAGVTKAIVNAHYLADQIIFHLEKNYNVVPLPLIPSREGRGNFSSLRKITPSPLAGEGRGEGVKILISNESDILETGGGVKHALPLLGADVFFTANSDILWRDMPGHIPAITRMLTAWDADKMDTLLLLADCNHTMGYDGVGDYFLQLDGRIQWRGDQPSAPYVFANVTIAKAKSFLDYPDTKFSQKKIWDAHEQQGRLYGIVHTGEWYHCSTPDDFAAVNAALAKAQK